MKDIGLRRDQLDIWINRCHRARRVVSAPPWNRDSLELPILGWPRSVSCLPCHSIVGLDPGPYSQFPSSTVAIVVKHCKFDVVALQQTSRVLL